MSRARSGTVIATLSVVDPDNADAIRQNHTCVVNDIVNLFTFNQEDSTLEVRELILQYERKQNLMCLILSSSHVTLHVLTPGKNALA